MNPRAAQSHRVRALTVALAAGGGVGAVFSTQAWPVSEAPWTTAPVMVLLLAVSALLLIRFHYREQVMALDLFESVLAGCILLFAPLTVVIMTAFTLLAVEVLHHRNEPLKIAFNVAQWTAAASAGTAVFHGMGGGEPSDPRTATALVAAMVAVALVNLLAFSAVLRMTQAERIGDVFRTVAPSILLSWAVNTLFGLIFVAIYSWTPAAIGIFFVALLILHAGYRGHATAMADKARVEALHRATRTIANEIHPEHALPEFLEEIRASFQAEAAEVVLFDAEKGMRTAYRKHGDMRVSVETAGIRDGLAERLAPLRASVRIDGDSDPGLIEAMRAEGWRDCIGAPLIADGEVLGVLFTFNRSGPEGFEEGEVSILGALAHEATNAIVKGKLLQAIMGERQRFSDIVNRTSDGIFTAAPDGTILTWNRGLEEMTGYLADELIGTRLFDGLQPRDEDGEAVTVHAALATGELPPANIQVTTRSGDVKWLSCSYTRLPADERGEEAITVVARDVTKERELDRLKDDFVATVSHELRTPLTPIKGWATTLMQMGERLQPSDRDEAARSILRQAEGLERLIVNLLDVAKIDRGVVDLREKVVDVRGVVEKVVDEARVLHPGREVLVEYPRSRCTAGADDLWVERILWNLVSNALKYAPATEPITIRVAEGAGGITVSVCDSGPGIPPNDLERIFDRFQRLGHHMTRETGGAGLGLYIARRLATTIGATLTVCSTPGVGSEFRLGLRPASALAAVG